MTASLLAICLAASASATTYVVDTDGDPGPGGTLSLRQAIALAVADPGSEVQFAPGLVGSTITLQQGDVFVEGSSDLSISGPGSDKLTISANPNYHENVFLIGDAVAFNLSGLTLTGGRYAGGYGGAIRAVGSSVGLRDVVIEGNYADGGGALYAINSNVSLTYVTIRNNTAGWGGGLYILSDAYQTSSLDASHVLITGNAATTGCCVNYIQKGGGGGYFRGAELTLQDAQISGNTAAKAGGGLLLKDSTLHLAGSTISGNLASGENGGGLTLYRSYAGIANSRVDGNSAMSGGGIALEDPTGESILKLTASTISGNHANGLHGFGGGIAAVNAYYVDLYRSLVSANATYDYAGDGGGGGVALVRSAGLNVITNSTVYGNYAYASGGGILVGSDPVQTTLIDQSTIVGNATLDGYSNGVFGGGSPLFLRGCIVANNASRTHNQDLSGAFNDIMYSLIENPPPISSPTTVTANNLYGVDPELGPLTVNGGPTLTLLPGATSPVLDAGDPSTTDLLDQRGLPRVVNGQADMGAVERQSPEDIIFRNGFDPP